VKKIKEHDVSAGKDDPFAGLPQIDEDLNLLEQDALMLIIRMLDDIENFDALSTDLQDMIGENIVLKTRIMQVFNVLIQGLIQEQKVLASIGFLP
jgi:hypothetical protein